MRHKRANNFRRNGCNSVPGAIIQCNGETNIDSTPSYVELQTCLEMERDVRVEREAETPK